jgi:hypothetical protein
MVGVTTLFLLSPSNSASPQVIQMHCFILSALSIIERVCRLIQFMEIRTLGPETLRFKCWQSQQHQIHFKLRLTQKSEVCRKF